MKRCVPSAPPQHTRLFGAGVLVRLCTVPCSGAGYLVLYNLVFVGPLVAILARSSRPPIYQKMARWQLHRRGALT